MVHIIQTTKKLYLKVNLEYFLRPRRYKLRFFRPSSGRPTSVTFIHLPIIGILRKIQDISTLDNSASGHRSRSSRVKVRVMAGGQGSYFRAFFRTFAYFYLNFLWIELAMHGNVPRAYPPPFSAPHKMFEPKFFFFAPKDQIMDLKGQILKLRYGTLNNPTVSSNLYGRQVQAWVRYPSDLDVTRSSSRGRVSIASEYSQRPPAQNV